MKPYILLIEDEPEIRHILSELLISSGYRVCEAGDGEEGMIRFEQNSFDLVLLDLMMPRMDGYAVCEKIRRTSAVPIIILTALDGEAAQIRAFQLHADDYITKPFSLAVLRARVNVQLRRAVPVKSDRVELDGFTFDFSRLEYARGGSPIELSRTEQRLLRLLVENRGRTLPRELLLEKVWDGGEFVDENALSVAVGRLRAKLGEAPIKTVYGVGYTWEAGR